MAQKTYRIRNVTRDALLADKSERASSFIKRGIGLIGRAGLPDGGGLIIQPCNSITCFMMRFPIDVLFVGSENQILHFIPAMKPWRNSKLVRGSKFVIELPAGAAGSVGTQVGDIVEIAPA